MENGHFMNMRLLMKILLSVSYNICLMRKITFAFVFMSMSHLEK